MPPEHYTFDDPPSLSSSNSAATRHERTHQATRDFVATKNSATTRESIAAHHAKALEGVEENSGAFSSVQRTARPVHGLAVFFCMLAENAEKHGTGNSSQTPSASLRVSRIHLEVVSGESNLRVESAQRNNLVVNGTQPPNRLFSPFPSFHADPAPTLKVRPASFIG